MLMETLFGADGPCQLKGNVLVCARRFQLHLIRLVVPYVTVNTDTQQHSLNDTRIPAGHAKFRRVAFDSICTCF